MNRFTLARRLMAEGLTLTEAAEAGGVELGDRSTWTALEWAELRAIAAAVLPEPEPEPEEPEEDSDEEPEDKPVQVTPARVSVSVSTKV